MPSIAVVGASNDRSKFGNKCVRAYALRGYDVYPVNPRADMIEGLPAYPSLAAVPVERIDRVSIYLPPAQTLTVLDEAASRPGGEVWLNPGSADEAVLARARKLGLNFVAECSIIAIGIDPADLD